MPAEAAVWTGHRPAANVSWDEALKTLSQEQGIVYVAEDLISSPYEVTFTQGATFTPRFLSFVDEAPARGVLAPPAGRRRVTSRRDVSEKRPWRDLPPLAQAIEAIFLRPVHLGSTVLPFGTLEPLLAVVPWDGKKLLSVGDPDLGRYPGLEAWLTQAEAVWTKHRSSDRMTLIDRINYQHGLSKQFPPHLHRVVYSASGQYLAAARRRSRPGR